MYKRIVLPKQVINTLSALIGCARRLFDWIGHHKAFMRPVFYLALFIYYLTIANIFTGPAYLSDEIGYLSKAATMSGSVIDSANSWFAGYSLVLTPAFMVGSTPEQIWFMITLLNSAIMVLGIFLLHKLLASVFRNSKKYRIEIAVLIAALYPSWVIMNSYAFTTVVFACLFTATCIVAARGGSGASLKNASLVGVYTGLLFFIHPLAIAVAAGVFVLFLMDAYRTRQYRHLAVFALIFTSLCCVYMLILHPYLNGLMTPLGMQQEAHYGSLKNNIHRLDDFGFWTNIALMIAGHLSYVLIASFGIVISSIHVLLKDISLGSLKNSSINPRNRVIILSMVAIMGAVFMGAITFNLVTKTGLVSKDEFIFGRYADMVLLPVLGVSIVLGWRKKPLLYGVLFLLVVGVALTTYADVSKTRDFNNLINTTSFWPSTLGVNSGYIMWFTVASIMLLLVFFSKKVAVPVIIIVTLLNIKLQVRWRGDIISSHSRPSGMYRMITDSYNPDDTCVAYSTSKVIPDGRYFLERYKLYNFYLTKYEPRRQSYDDWLSSDCSLYFTYDRTEASNAAAMILGREEGTGLFVLSKKFAVEDDSTPKWEDDFYFNSQYSNTRCVLNGCIERKAHELKDFLGTGVLSGKQIESNGQEGYIFFGPYTKLDRGSYRVVFEGNLVAQKGSYIEIRDAETKIRLAKEELRFNDFNDGVSEISFNSSEDIGLLEIRMLVTSKSTGAFIRYKIESN